MKKKLFISYSHEDKKIVKEYASILSLHGFDLWMDEKDISRGDYYTTKILKGIHDSDIYVVFVSHNSVSSSWVEAEIDFALKEKIEYKKLIIIPILIDDVEILVSLSNIDYYDARYANCHTIVKEFSKVYDESEIENKDITISSISFEISQSTSVEVGPFNESFSADDLAKDRNHILEELRKKAYGILLNFVSAMDFDFQSAIPRFSNGLYEENCVIESGSTVGSIRENIIVEALVFNPDVKKLNRLMQERLSVLNISAITFGFNIPVKPNETLMDVGKRCLAKLQEEYLILSYDVIDGAKIEVANDLFLSFSFSEEIVKIKLNTKYDFQFESRLQEFSLFAFLQKLLND